LDDENGLILRLDYWFGLLDRRVLVDLQPHLPGAVRTGNDTSRMGTQTPLT
jgi:hypothetical protein